MTAKEFVRAQYRNARAEKQRTNAKEVYWLIRDGINTMYIASGKTESNAWANAKNFILETTKTTNNG